MKIAYFSPFLPKRSGISTYSEELVRALRKLMAVDAFDFNNVEAGDPCTAFGDFARQGRISDLAKFDAIVYHIGNNPHYHLDIFKTLRDQPGIVVLHDTVLYFLIAGLGRGGLLKYLSMVEEGNALESFSEIIRNSVDQNILRYQQPEKHPLVPAIFPYARRIIVHNEPARQRVVEMGYAGPAHVIPQLAPFEREFEAGQTAPTDLHRQHNISRDEIIIGCFGFIGRTKRIAQICRALARLNGRVRFRFLLVGEGEDVSHLIRDAGLEERTIQTGFVEASQFSHYLQMSDIVVNLRYPSMGESSWTLMQAQKLGKAVLVTRDGAFADLPDDIVCKIDIGPDEERDIAAIIERLAADPALRLRIGEAGRRYIETTLDPINIARQFQRVVELDTGRAGHSVPVAVETTPLRRSETISRAAHN